MKANREFRITHSDRTRVRASCVDQECSFRINSVRVHKNGKWVVRYYVKEHICSLDLRMTRCRGIATSKAIFHMVIEDGMGPNKIREFVQRVHGVNISYWKAWKAKEIGVHLVRGGAAESYTRLVAYFWLLEKSNPRTYSTYQLSENSCFKQCFWLWGRVLLVFNRAYVP
ncbi:hypothetical protein LIER_32577 [Lithospermum erythrorhizon]|uniref:Transposase MuDR plant domain-containing protein n=1 Tax=Lithospermum erythrorhizon TaxID=34254 RepID=A0AAV3RV56_LITER